MKKKIFTSKFKDKVQLQVQLSSLRLLSLQTSHHNVHFKLHEPNRKRFYGLVESNYHLGGGGGGGDDALLTRFSPHVNMVKENFVIF